MRITKRSKNAKTTILAALAALVLALVLTACGGDSLAGKTLYNVSPSGEKTSITFDKEGGWHGVDDSGEGTGVWSMEGDNVVLTTSSGWSTFTFVPVGDGVWQERGGEEWEQWYPSEEQAEAATEEYLAAQQAAWQAQFVALLEGSTWTFADSESIDSEGLSVVPTISFSDGMVTYTKAVASEWDDALSEDWGDEEGWRVYWEMKEEWRKDWEEKGYWFLSDHSGPYTTTAVSNGTIEIDGTPLTINVYRNKGAASYIILGDESQSWELRFKTEE